MRKDGVTSGRREEGEGHIIGRKPDPPRQRKESSVIQLR